MNWREMEQKCNNVSLKIWWSIPTLPVYMHVNFTNLILPCIIRNIFATDNDSSKNKMSNELVSGCSPDTSQKKRL